MDLRGPAAMRRDGAGFLRAELRPAQAGVGSRNVILAA
jgi:hypothetical protein